MSWSKALAAAALLALAGCTASPLHGSAGINPATGQGEPSLAALAGRISVVEPNDRTDQIVRNALLFRLNAGRAVSTPLYEITLATSAVDRPVSIQGGTGLPAASVYRIQATYALRRLSDGETIASGSRFSTAPYDRSQQQFAGQRALLDAREKAGAELGERVATAVLPVLRRELRGETLRAPVAQTVVPPPLGEDEFDPAERLFR